MLTVLPQIKPLPVLFKRADYIPAVVCGVHFLLFFYHNFNFTNTVPSLSALPGGEYLILGILTLIIHLVKPTTPLVVMGKLFLTCAFVAIGVFF